MASVRGRSGTERRRPINTRRDAVADRDGVQRSRAGVLPSSTERCDRRSVRHGSPRLGPLSIKNSLLFKTARIFIQKKRCGRRQGGSATRFALRICADARSRRPSQNQNRSQGGSDGDSVKPTADRRQFLKNSVLGTAALAGAATGLFGKVDFSTGEVGVARARAEDPLQDGLHPVAAAHRAGRVVEGHRGGSQAAADRSTTSCSTVRTRSRCRSA